MRPLPGITDNLLPDTDTWYMSNGSKPDKCGGYSFEATFNCAWEGFICDLNPTLIERVKGRKLAFGVDSLEGADARLEILMDGAYINGIESTDTPKRVITDVPETVSSMTIRLIIFGTDDLHCKFTGVSLKFV